MCGLYQVYPFWFLDNLDVFQEPAGKNTKEAQELVINYQEAESYKTS